MPTPCDPRSSGNATTRAPSARAFLQPGPCSATVPENSCPKTIGCSLRMKPFGATGSTRSAHWSIP